MKESLLLVQRAARKALWRRRVAAKGISKGVLHTQLDIQIRSARYQRHFLETAAPLSSSQSPSPAPTASQSSSHPHPPVALNTAPSPRRGAGALDAAVASIEADKFQKAQRPNAYPVYSAKGDLASTASRAAVTSKSLRAGERIKGQLGYSSSTATPDTTLARPAANKRPKGREPLRKLALPPSKPRALRRTSRHR